MLSISSNYIKPSYYYTINISRDNTVQSRIVELKETSEQKKYRERLQNYAGDSGALADWYIFLLDELLAKGETCEYLRGRSTPEKIEAIDRLEKEIKDLLGS
ncbi:MAG: hypothetical protein LBQ83_08235 [Candidatus Margulisbacteria bacterium]|jgi:hypothetical protein|nr:hypothetical protein [Candidatus Margulisiibacteriota bacterium]